MKHIHKAVLTRPGADDLPGKGSGARSRLAVLSLAVGAALMQCLTSVQADDALPTRQPDTQPMQTQKPAYIPQGRQMERYKAFARQTELPPITATNDTVLQVGGVVNADATPLAKLSTRDKNALAGQLNVPVGVINTFAQQLAGNSPPAAGQLAQGIRTAVIDYRFLQIEWERYHPPAEGQKTRAAALEALQAGDLRKAWELYDGLRRPLPPANVRIVAQP